MATTPGTRTRTPARHEPDVDYPTSDSRPMGETDLHRQDMFDVINTLAAHFAADPNVYVSGNLLVYYERGNKRKHVSPDAFVVRGVPKLPPRDYYLIWEEGKSPDVVIEITSKTTRREDQHKKWALYRDVLKVPEYFQFDPTEDYLKPPMQGFRLIGEEYVPIEPVAGRLPSEVLGLHLERDGTELRLYDPATGQRLLTPQEHADEAERRAEEADRQLAAARAENERLRRELDELRRRQGGA
jgi:Uma2 family endonuclease